MGGAFGAATGRKPPPGCHAVPRCTHPSAVSEARLQRRGRQRLPESHPDAARQAAWRRSRGLVWDPPWANSKPLLVREPLLLSTWLLPPGRAHRTTKSVRGREGSERHCPKPAAVCRRQLLVTARPRPAGPWSRPPPLPTPRARRRCPGKRCGRSSHCRGGGRPARPAEALPPVSGRPDPEPGNCLASSPGHSLGRSVASGLTQHCLWPPARARATCEDRRPVLHSEGDPGGWADQELDRCSGSHAAAAPPWGDVVRESRLGASPPAASAVWPEALEPPIPQLRRVLASGIIPKCLLLRWGWGAKGLKDGPSAGTLRAAGRGGRSSPVPAPAMPTWTSCTPGHAWPEPRWPLAEMQFLEHMRLRRPPGVCSDPQ